MGCSLIFSMTNGKSQGKCIRLSNILVSRKTLCQGAWGTPGPLSPQLWTRPVSRVADCIMWLEGKGRGCGLCFVNSWVTSAALPASGQGKSSRVGSDTVLEVVPRTGNCDPMFSFSSGRSPSKASRGWRQGRGELVT